MSPSLQWGAPRFLPAAPPGLAQDPRWTVAPNEDGHLELFALGADGAVWHIWEDQPNSVTWSNWASLGAPAGANLLASGYQMFAVQNEDGRVEVFVSDAQWNVWHIWQLAKNANWIESWSSLSHPSNALSNNDDYEIAVGIDNGGCLQVLMQDLGDGAGTIYSRSQEAKNGVWTNDWESLGAPPAVFADFVLSAQDQSLFTRVYVQAQDLFQKGTPVFRAEKSFFVAGSSDWDGWTPVFDTPPGVVGLSIQTAVSNQDKRIELFAVDTSKGDLWHTWQSNGNTWSGVWDNLGHAQNTTTDAFDVCRDQQGCLTVASWQSDGFLYTITQTAASNGWGGWYRIQTYGLSGFVEARIRLIAEQSGLLSLFSLQRGNQLMYIRQILLQ